MSGLLVLSILVRLVALALSIALYRRVRDWRMAFLALMVALMALRQSLTLWREFEFWTIDWLRQPHELPGLAASVMVLLAVLCLAGILAKTRATEAFLADAQRIAHLGNWAFKVKTNKLRWSDEIYRIFGLAPQSFGATYEAFVAAVHPEDREAVEQAVDRALYEKEPYSIDHRIVRPSGEIRTVHEQAEVTFDNKGKPIQMTGTVQDITELRKMEEMLRRTQFSVEYAADPVLWVAPSSRYVYANEAACRLLGYTREELLSLTVHDIDPTFPSAPEAEIWEAVKKRKSWTFETTNRTKDGRILPVEIACNYLTYEGKEYNFTFVRDLTKRRALEEKLRQATKMEAIGGLAGGIAHDFNNLLTVITGMAALALGRVDSEGQLRGDLELVYNAGMKAADLTRQLLAFSRQQVLRPRVLDLNAVITEFESFLRRTIEENIEIRKALDPTLGRTKADPGQIEQVLMNLVVNARDAMPDGGELSIETMNVQLEEAYANEHGVVAPGRYVMLAVTDTGIGIDEETQSRIFDPFFTTKEKRGGTGLGLATVYGIIKQSGGYIWVYSEPGGGTTFKIYLPRVEEAVDPATWKEAVTEVKGGSETILLAEDNDMVRVFAVRTLEDRGYQVLAAEHPEKALQICKEHEGSIELLVTDLVMPGSSGVELMKQVRQLVPSVKTLYISGYADKAILHNGQLEEQMEFLGKPFGASALARKVREILDK